MTYSAILFLIFFMDRYADSCTGEASPSLRRLISVFNRENSTTIIYEEYYNDEEPLLDHITDYSHPLSVFEMGSFYSLFEDLTGSVVYNASLKDYYRRLNFLVISRMEALVHFLKYVTDLDNRIGQGSLLRHFSTWLIISPDRPPNLDITLDHVSAIRISYSRQERYLTNRQMRFEMKIAWSLSEKDVYTLLWMPGGREWSRVHFCEKSHDQMYNAMFPNKVRGLNGRQLRLSTLEWPLFAVRKHKDGKTHYRGAGIHGVDLLGRKFNFSYVVVEPDDMLWGQELVNGSWTGVTGMIQRGEADMSPVPYALSVRRQRIMDYSSSFLSADYLAVYRRRPDDTQSWLYFMSCFSWQIYACGAAAVLWIVILLLCKHHRHCRNRNVAFALEVTFNVPLRQGITKLPEECSAMIIVFTWCMFCLVMTGVYSGKLVAFATVEKYQPPFTTLQELAEQDEYTVGVLEGTYPEVMLMNSADALLKTIYKKISEAGGASNTTDDGIRRLLEEKHVLICGNSVMEVVKSMTCDMVQVKERLITAHSGYIYPRYSPLKKLFDEQIILLRELGVFEKLRRDWNLKPKICDAPVHAAAFRLDNLKTVLITSLTGILVAVIVLLVEIRRKR